MVGGAGDLGDSVFSQAVAHFVPGSSGHANLRIHIDAGCTRRSGSTDARL